ncbi:MAG: sigma-70 family RNA polymerase sigma factor [Candidatus Marinimicrobia bacterium]|jgi:RNA polymerase sigma-70 factor (ECF subfamily)|nr:sigma-70 family RNA polymerase sigma factor [Candidatus Neomarinimicrobiota bacterium]|tara:strand:- start:1197 stop:1721 length:525 start_codon:yes stop_codon:yes gene_type:complete
MKDGDLVIRFQNGEEQAFDELVKRHYSTTHNLLVRLSGNSMDADDLCQETFIRVYRSLRKFKAQSQFSTWLYRIAVNVANSHHRKEKVRQLLSFGNDPETMAVDESTEPRELDPEMWDAIHNLPQKQKMVLTLRIFQELPFKEVASILNMSENSAKVNYHHAIQRLKERLGEKE